MEMTGLNVFKDQIIECACILTDYKLKQIIKGPHLVIHSEKEILDSMDEWCTNTHKGSGLYEASLKSQVSIKEAEQQMLIFLKSYNIEPQTLCLAGNSVYMDRLFLMRQMPDLDQFLHYRIVDVSSIRLLCENLNPNLFKQKPKKKLNHRALDDVIESIQELRFYQHNFLIKQLDVL